MNILMFAHFAGSPQHGMVYGHYYLAREWVKKGHQVTIIAAFFSHSRFKNPHPSWKITESFIDGIRYIWLPTPRYKSGNYIGRVLNILMYSFQAYFRKFLIHPPNLVICSSHHPFAIHAAHRYAKKFKTKLIFEVRDLWPLTLMEVGKVTAKHPFIKLMQFSEDYAYRHADKVVSVLSNSQSYMVGRGMSHEKFVFIPNGGAVDEINVSEPMPETYGEQLAAARAKGQCIVGYAGKISHSKNLEAFLEAIALCNGETVMAALLGEGPLLTVLKHKAHDLGIDAQVLFLNSVPKPQVSDFLSQIDVAYLGIYSKPLFKYGISPTKVNDYMLAARPIILASNAPDDYIGPSGAGLTCPPEDAKALAQLIQEFVQMSPAERSDMGERGRKWIQQERDYQVLAEKWLNSF